MAVSKRKPFINCRAALLVCGEKPKYLTLPSFCASSNVWIAPSGPHLFDVVLPTQMMQLIEVKMVCLEQLQRSLQLFAGAALSRFLVLQARK